MESLERESACEHLKETAERISPAGDTKFHSGASKFKWARPLNAYVMPDVRR
jgi:hypothetical protein